MRPRKRHKYKTPQELFDKEIDAEIKRVALAS